MKHSRKYRKICFTPKSRARSIASTLLSIIFNTAHAIDARTADYLRAALCNSRAGVLCLRPKIHKVPVGVRPIINLRSSWTALFALFLSEALQPMQLECQHLLQSADDFLHAYANGSFSSDDDIAIIDAINLYPSIGHDHLCEKMVPRIRGFYRNRQSFGSFIITVFLIVIRTQVVRHDGKFYLAFKSICTGLSPGVQIANIYLSELDAEVAALPVKAFSRFLDDACFTASLGTCQLVMETLNSWHSSIRWTLSGVGRHKDSFLDLCLSLEQNSEATSRLRYTLHRKEMNKYLYLPRNSCHPANCFRAVIQGEAWRIHKRCDQSADVVRELAFFAGKLADRGYSYSEIEASLDRVNAKFDVHASTGIKRRAPTDAQRVARLMLQFSSSVNLKFLRMCLKQVEPLLRSHLDVGFRVQSNIFRTLYAATWARLRN